MKRLPKHRNLPELLGHSSSAGVGSIVMSYFPFPTLSDFIEVSGPLKSEFALCLLTQIVRFGFLLMM